MKPLEFVGSSLADLSAFPIEARRAAGFELWQIQSGLAPSDFKPMPAIGAGAYEIRIRVLGEWRVIYLHDTATRSTSFTRSKRRHGGRREATSSWRGGDTGKLRSGDDQGEADAIE